MKIFLLNQYAGLMHGPIPAWYGGAGGTGSPLAQNFVYLGARDFVFVEPDASDETRMNRLVPFETRPRRRIANGRIPPFCTLAHGAARKPGG